MRISDWSSDVCSSDLLVFADGTPDIIAYPETRFGWGRLTRMLTIGNLRTKKGGCILYLSDLLDYCADLLLIVMPPLKEEQDTGAILSQLTQVRPGSVWLGAVMRSEEHTSELQSLMSTSYAVMCLKQ